MGRPTEPIRLWTVSSGRFAVITLEMSTWDAKQLRTFIDAVAEHRLRVAFLLGATTGMRRGEVLGLRWSDLDLRRRRVTIVQTVLNVG